jgi:hypothetical protein
MAKHDRESSLIFGMIIILIIDVVAIGLCYIGVC